jgi:hypothetical protein
MDGDIEPGQWGIPTPINQQLGQYSFLSICPTLNQLLRVLMDLNGRTGYSDMPHFARGIHPKDEQRQIPSRYRDSTGKEHLKRFALKRDAQRWLDQETTKLQTGTWVAPRTAKTTVGEWCDVWLANYATRKPSTVRQARVHVAKIKEAFGGRRLDSIRPSEIRAWTVDLKEEGHAPSYVAALHQRMAQIYSDAVHDGLVARSPLSRRTSPGQGRQRPYVASTAQMWALHDATEPRYRAGLLLAAFAGYALPRSADYEWEWKMSTSCGASCIPCSSTQPNHSRPRSAVPRCRYLKTWCSSCQRIWSSSPLSGSCAMRWASRWVRGNAKSIQGREERRGRSTGGFPVPRSAALLCLAADRLRAGCQGCAGSSSACVREDHLGHLRAPLARLG